jgi:hypothetical protein
MKFTIRVDGVDYEVEAPSQALAQAIAQERARHDSDLQAEKARADAAETKASEAVARSDAAEKQVAELQAQLDAERDPARRARDAAELQELTSKAQVVAGRKIDAAGTPHEIRLAALKAGGEDVLAAIPEGRKDDTTYVEVFTAARFDAAYTARKDARSSVVTPPKTNTDTNDDPVVSALARRDAEKAAQSRKLRGLPPLERS